MRFRVLARKSTTSLSGWVRDTHEHPGLRHPLWWVALFVLLANDHVLKQAGALPPVLTGKLSDFAGLIVAPVLLAALVRARSTRPVAICFAATAVVFAAINLDSACAVAMERVTASLGVGWTIYPDPTDLIALTVLPVAWSIARTAPTQTRRTWERWVERAALGLGLLACIATSKNDGGMRGQDWTEWTASTYVVNNTDEVVDLRVRWFTGQLDCDAVQTRLSRALAPDVFDEGIHFSLQPHHSVPIGRSFALDAAGIDGDLDFDRPDDRPGNDCHAALLQAEGMPDYIAFWRAREVGITTFTEVSPAIKRGRLELAGPATARHITPFLGVMVEPARRHIEPPRGCAPVTPAVSWSLVPSSWRYFRIETIDNLPDGCLDIALTPVHGPFEPDVPLPNPRRFSACIPANRFPFGPGDEVEIRADERLDIRHEDGRSLYAANRHGGAYYDDDYLLNQVDVAASIAVESGCTGMRTPCNAFVLPGELLPSHTPNYDGFFYVHGGRAENVIVAPRGCGPDRSTIGHTFNLAISHNPEDGGTQP